MLNYENMGTRFHKILPLLADLVKIKLFLIIALFPQFQELSAIPSGWSLVNWQSQVVQSLIGRLPL